MSEFLNRVGAWYRNKYGPVREDAPAAPIAEATIPENHRNRIIKWLFGGFLAFLMIQFACLFVPHAPTPSSKSVLNDQNAPSATTRSSLQSLGLNNDGPESITDQLKRITAEKEQARLRALQLAQQGQQQPPPQQYGGDQKTAAEAAAEERRKKDEEALLSSSLIAIPEAASIVTAPPSRSPAVITQASDVAPAGATVPTAGNATSPGTKDCLDETTNGVIRYAICEGTTIELVLDNRIVGEFTGPAKAYVLYDQYSADKKHVILPRGTVVLGKAESVEKQNQRRVSVAFHRFILPNGRGLSLDDMVALDQVGAAALPGKVNRHLAQTFGTAAVIGALAGFSQFGSGSAFTGNGIDAYRQGISSQIGQTGQQTLQRDLQRLPSITIPEGSLSQLYISSDLHLPEYVEARK